MNAFSLGLRLAAGCFAALGIGPWAPGTFPEARSPMPDARLEWKEVISKEGGFRVSFPTEPKLQAKEIETGAGRLTHHVYMLEEGPYDWVVSWLDFPPDYVRRTGTVALLQGAQEACFKRFKGKLLSEKVIVLGAATGRDVVFDTEDKVKLRLRIYLRRTKLIQVLVLCEPDLIESEDVKRFFDSFKWE